MRAKRSIISLSVLALSVVSVWAGEAIDTSTATPVGAEAGTSLPSPTGITAIKPWIHGAMPDDMKMRLEAGFELALQKVQDVPECRGLFEALGADALETLRTGLYFPIGSNRKEKAVCGRAVAYTNVGAAPTFLCRDFSHLSDDRAAMYVIHEALHHAGLTEKPHDKGAMSSRAINSMVTNACKLQPPVECLPRLPQLHHRFSYPFSFARTLLRALFLGHLGSSDLN